MNKEWGFVRNIFVTTVWCLLIAAGPEGPHKTAKLSMAVDDKPVALLFHGSGGCKDCPEAAARLLDGFTVIDVGPGASKRFPSLTQDLLDGADLWIQPGDDGDVDDVDKDFSKAEHKMLNRWVEQGGRYLGICMGAYLAGTKPGFKFLDYSVDSYVGKGGVKNTKATLVDVDWRGTKRKVYYQDGPYFKGEGIARYKSGKAAAVLFPFGKGKVALVGVHTEAPRSWDKKAPDNLALGVELVKELMK